MTHHPAGAIAPNPLLTVTQAARSLGVSTKTIYRRIYSGDLPTMDISPKSAARAQHRIKLEDLNALANPYPAYGYNPKAQAFTTRAAS
ncbi:helix-turn-helix domain-containing protein [Tessaracoccus sp. Y36]